MVLLLFFVAPPVFVIKQLQADTIGTSYIPNINSNIYVNFPRWDVAQTNQEMATLVAKIPSLWIILLNHQYNKYNVFKIF